MSDDYSTPVMPETHFTPPSFMGFPLCSSTRVLLKQLLQLGSSEDIEMVTSII